MIVFSISIDSPLAPRSSPPFGLGFDTSKTVKTDAARMKSVASTKWRPGQMRFPAPKASGIADGSLRGVPEGVRAAPVAGTFRKRSGLNVSGSG